MSHFIKRTNNEQGFTLLEVLVAFVIMTVSLGLIYSFLVSGMERSEVSSTQMMAILIAESKMAESELLPMKMEGEMEDFSWSVSKTLQQSTNQNQQRLNLSHVKVVVTWNLEGHDRQFELESLRPVLP